jgi:hypothetical protein
VAALLRKQFNVEVETTAGKTGEFTVWMNRRLVVPQDRLGLPSDQKVLKAVRAALKK